jgi:alpha,alpha-trehalose phosphorylase
MTIACGIDHVVETDCEYQAEARCDEDGAGAVFSVRAAPGQSFQLTKYMPTTPRATRRPALGDRAERTLDRAVQDGWEVLLATQWRFVDDFWQRSDVQIRGDARCSSRCAGTCSSSCRPRPAPKGAGIGARGLTGQTYEGHYFWDTEIYVLPFLVYTAPRIARNLLRFRHGMLDKARSGPSRSASRAPCSPGARSTARRLQRLLRRRHGPVPHQRRHRLRPAQVRRAERRRGLPARVRRRDPGRDGPAVASLGFFSERKDGKFCIHAVTGPDEYNTVVNNNTFTNLMARENLRYAGRR